MARFGYKSTSAAKNGGKPWKYLLVPHDVVAENMSLVRDRGSKSTHPC